MRAASITLLEQSRENPALCLPLERKHFVLKDLAEQQ
jgi:hypothetical protein